MAFHCNCFSRGISLTGEKLRGTFLIDIVLQPTTKVFFSSFAFLAVRFGYKVFANICSYIIFRLRFSLMIVFFRCNRMRTQRL